MKIITGLTILFTGISSYVFTQAFSDLHPQKVGSVQLYYSQQIKEDLTFYGSFLDQANAYFSDVFELPIQQVNLLALHPEDWENYAYPGLIYGMPHFKKDVKAIIIASEDNEFWKSQLPEVSKLPSPFKELMMQTYTVPNGHLSARNFFDLLSIHELAHLWSAYGNLFNQRLWLEEVFCNLALHTFIAEERGEWLGSLEVLPSVHANHPEKTMYYTSLASFEQYYYKIGMEVPYNYGWYQFRFHFSARQLYNTGGPKVLKKLWDFLQNYTEKLSDEELIVKLSEDVHPYFRSIIEEW